MSDTADAAPAAENTQIRANVMRLVVCQALAMSGTVMVVAMSGLAGHVLATDKSLATIPFAMQFVGTFLATMPASH
ncbi:MAG: hypothetical protein VW405_05160, partial [Rhodospirillaceae bacterium]